ncbi:hypothetical protein VPHK460_0304 [Vibrio phage K460]
MQPSNYQYPVGWKRIGSDFIKHQINLFNCTRASPYYRIGENHNSGLVPRLVYV